MKTYILFFIILIIGCGISCKKDSLTSDLKGQWVRADNRSDTITFGYKGQDDWFELFRGYELYEDGISRPKKPSGLWTYQIQENSIKIHWIASSSLEWQEYSFLINGAEIEMGNFIDGTNPKIILEKIK